MRIRKHAARILSSLSIPAQSFAAAAAEAEAGVAGARELEMHVCELNQSPWDAMAFTPPGSVPFDAYQELEELGEDNGFAWSGQTEEEEVAAVAAATVSDVSGNTSTAESTWKRQVKVEVMAEQAAEEGEIKRERKKEYAKKRNTTGSSDTKKTKNTSSRAAGAAGNEKVKMEVESPPTAAAAASTCKKIDGKGWHCKRAAQHPHSLCEYHLTQVRSYYGNGVGAGHALQQQQQQALLKAQNAASVPDNKKKNKKKTTTATKKGSSGHGDKSSVSSDGASRKTRRKPESDFFYYYSGFGPWRGKRRSGGGGVRDGGERGIPSNADASDGDDERAEAPRDGAPSLRVHDQGPDDLDDDDDDDMDGGDGAVGCGGRHDVAAGRRRGMKPIKARSLKSLL